MLFYSKYPRSPTLLLAALLLGGCAVSPPVQEMSDARQAVKAASAVTVDGEGVKRLQDAERYLDEATERLEAGEYEAARQAAIAAKNEAARVRESAVSSQP